MMIIDKPMIWEMCRSMVSSSSSARVRQTLIITGDIPDISLAVKEITRCNSAKNGRPRSRKAVPAHGGAHLSNKGPIRAIFC
jgi:hypothetical protein